MTSPLRLCVRRSPGPGPAPLPVQVRVRLPSDVDCVEEAVELLVRHCLAGCDPEPRTTFRLRVALAEALANAILRGNGGDRTKSVDVTAEVTYDSIRLFVTDEGAGFDPTAIPEPTRPELLGEACGRGLFLIRNLVDSVQFNAQGNSICMTLRRH